MRFLLPVKKIDWKWLGIFLVVITAATSIFFYFIVGLPVLENLVVYLIAPLGIIFVILLRGACDLAGTSALSGREDS